MPRKAKNEDHINKKGDLPFYPKSVSDYLDGKGRMLFITESEWARALFLFLRIVGDRDGEGELALDELVDYARQIGTSAMIKREEFDKAVIKKLEETGIDAEEAQALLDAIPDKSIKRAADAFDIRAGELGSQEKPVWMDNALRAIRSCVPVVGSREYKGSLGITIPRSAAGIMGAVCLTKDSGGIHAAAPVCENGDTILGFLDFLSATRESSEPVFTASVPDKLCSALCKMSHAAAGHPVNAVDYLFDSIGKDPVPGGFNHASYDAVLVSGKSFFAQVWEYGHEHKDEDGKFVYDTTVGGSLTDPYPSESEKVLSYQLATIRFCCSLLAEQGRAAIWIPSKEDRGGFTREIRNQILSENLLDAVVEFRELPGSSPRLNEPMSIWFLRRGRPDGEPVLLALLDGEGFDAFCGGSSSPFYAGIDKSLSKNPSAIKVADMVLNRTPVDKCATLVSPDTILQNESCSFRFIDYKSNIDIAANLASAASWSDLVKEYEESVAEVHGSDEAFLAALERFDKLMEKEESR